jgi:hypothetical protein
MHSHPNARLTQKGRLRFGTHLTSSNAAASDAPTAGWPGTA